ncbi:hypothetical protein RKE29_29755 [Streptomyces sp. B1866]|uniref:hypothetical protein n=1 Tax=Streptomyces sp. B1866 TaxID=3075431 RepID=UPI00288CBC00|nr:hypothetical protein [Streptomyces sp. B1866]MDT3400736.1 hypothetical protein [Streptomyces sp. B1866]
MAAGIALVAAAGISMTACSSEKKDPPEYAWADSVCETVVQPSSGKVQLPQVDPKKEPKESQQRVVAFLDGISAELLAQKTRLKQEGAPPVDGGQQSLDEALKNLDGTQAAVKDAADDMRNAKVTDEKSYFTAATGAGQAFAKFSTYKGLTDDLRKNPKLNTAFDKADACKSLSSDAPAPATSG